MTCFEARDLLTETQLHNVALWSLTISSRIAVWVISTKRCVSGGLLNGQPVADAMRLRGDGFTHLIHRRQQPACSWAKLVSYNHIISGKSACSALSLIGPLQNNDRGGVIDHVLRRHTCSRLTACRQISSFSSTSPWIPSAFSASTSPPQPSPSGVRWSRYDWPDS
ncbi:MAG: hypothetical protein GPOALKHO_001558 [Sodalis sp.]|nr:MAG: hypothetical protein GPOALKHO_001558 [Sodalis sp.]